MNKILIVLLVLISLSFGNGSFINFIPYETSDCSGSILGVGWSILEYSCFSIDVKYNYQLTTHTSNGETILQWVQFPRVEGKTTCFYQGLPINKVSIGSCYQNTGASSFDINRSPPTNQYYLISITDEPYYPNDLPATTIFQYMGNGECSSDNVEVIQYFTNNTQSQDGVTGIQMNWYCDSQNNKPFENQCYQGANCFNMPKQYHCSHTHPFFNSSSEISGGTGAGDYSGSGSGSGSGSSGNSASSSGGLSIIINENDKLNIDNINNNNIGYKSTTGDADSSESHHGNYLTSFCT